MTKSKYLPNSIQKLEELSKLNTYYNSLNKDPEDLTEEYDIIYHPESDSWEFIPVVNK